MLQGSWLLEMLPPAAIGIVAVAAATSLPSKRGGGYVGVRWVGAGVIAHGCDECGWAGWSCVCCPDSANAVVVGVACSFIC